MKSDNLKTFKQRVELSSYVDNSLAQNLSSNDTQKANDKIRTILEDVNNSNITDVQVVDAKGNIRGDNDVDKRSLVGQRTTDSDIK